ncbi:MULTISPECIES: membrane lipoprotein lipid attachment site-containing protein [Sporosarcina]|nr:MULTISPECIES: membrane lipoprotein lipid attachment site-containing protein [Sporosarcina]MBY0221640.1 membrane lipoprotein lipid attachment site-containing protein [Sporosarcina aquimarina]
MKKLLILFVAMLGVVLAACSGQTDKDTPKTPEISKSAIDEAAASTKDNMMIEEASATVEGDTVHFVVTVSDDSISQDYAQETGEEFANLLASNYAEENESADPLWESHDLTIKIQTDKDHTLWEASKKKDSDSIEWK